MKIISLLVGKKAIFIRIICWVAVILYIAVIFAFSHQEGNQSNKLSNEAVEKLKENIELPSPIKQKIKSYKIDYNLVLRKIAHFTLYFGDGFHF